MPFSFSPGTYGSERERKEADSIRMAFRDGFAVRRFRNSVSTRCDSIFIFLFSQLEIFLTQSDLLERSQQLRSIMRAMFLKPLSYF